MIEVAQILRMLPRDVAEQVRLGLRMGFDSTDTIHVGSRFNMKLPDTPAGHRVKRWIDTGEGDVGLPTEPAMAHAAFASATLRAELLALLGAAVVHRRTYRHDTRGIQHGAPQDPLRTSDRYYAGHTEERSLTDRVESMHRARFHAYQTHGFGSTEVRLPKDPRDGGSSVAPIHHQFDDLSVTTLEDRALVLPSNWYRTIVKPGLFGFDKMLTVHVIYRGWYDALSCHMYECAWLRRGQGSRYDGRCVLEQGALAEHCPGGKHDRTRRSFARSTESIDAAAKLAKRRFSGWERKQLAEVAELASSGKPICWERYPALATPDAPDGTGQRCRVQAGAPVGDALERVGRSHFPSLLQHPQRLLGATDYERIRLESIETYNLHVVVRSGVDSSAALRRYHSHGRHRGDVAEAVEKLAAAGASRRGRMRDAARRATADRSKQAALLALHEAAA